jgi:hypothetical protein
MIDGIEQRLRLQASISMSESFISMSESFLIARSFAR